MSKVVLKQTGGGDSSVHPAVQDMVPPAWVADQYVSRTVNKVLDLDLLSYAATQGWNVLFYGPTGAGKSHLVRAWAAQEGLPYGAVPCNGAADSASMFGGHSQDEDGKWHWQDGIVTKLVRHGGVLDLDELNMARPAIMAVLHSLLDKRRSIVLMDNGGEVVKAHDDLLIVASYNPDYAGTFELNEATRNRFELKFPWDYSDDVESVLIPESDSLRKMVKDLRKQQREGVIDSPVPTNVMMEFIAVAEDIGLDFAVANFVNNFRDDEQDSVSNVVTLHKDRIADDLRRAFGRDPYVGAWADVEEA